jgi:hypothetical protein
LAPSVRSNAAGETEASKSAFFIGMAQNPAVRIPYRFYFRRWDELLPAIRKRDYDLKQTCGKTATHPVWPPYRICR